METIRYFIELSYHGGDYCGWQRQPEDPSIQEEIEDCLTKLNSNESVKIVGCGRTDTGVHAHHFIAHFDYSEILDVDKFRFKLNRMLPLSIAINKIFKSDKHARFDAVERTYRYFINQNKNAFLNDRSCFLKADLDIDKMNEAAQVMIGKMDFTSLSKLHTDVKTNICDVRFAKWEKVSENELVFEIRADRFLRNMVRATVGTLLDVGMGKISAQEYKDILEAKNRCEASVSVPAQGLFLWEVKY